MLHAPSRCGAPRLALLRAVTPGLGRPATPLKRANIHRSRRRFAATTRGVSEVPRAFCADVTDQLKHAKFDADFDRMVLWRQERKPAELAELAT
jgi:hypothetical protein